MLNAFLDNNNGCIDVRYKHCYISIMIRLCRNEKTSFFLFLILKKLKMLNTVIELFQRVTQSRRKGFGLLERAFRCLYLHPCFFKCKNSL